MKKKFSDKITIFVIFLFIFALAYCKIYAQPIQDLRFKKSSTPGPNGTLTVTVQAKVDVAADWGTSTYRFNISDNFNVTQVNSSSLASTYSTYTIQYATINGSGDVEIRILEPGTTGVALSVGVYTDLFTIIFNNNGTAIDLTNIRWAGPTNQALTVFGGGTMTVGNLINSDNVPLPIILSNFQAFPFEAKGNKIVWTTSTEINNEEFTILRSPNGKDYMEIIRIPGAGNSNSNINYSYIDTAPEKNMSFYIIKQADFDGIFTLSMPILVLQHQTNKCVIYPNPTKDIIHVFGLRVASMCLRDITGKILIDTITSDTFSIENLNSGIYYLHITDNDGEISIVKILKNENLN